MLFAMFVETYGFIRALSVHQVMDQRQEYLDETFLASVFAYSRKVRPYSLVWVNAH
jgi:hypothetical protein